MKKLIIALIGGRQPDDKIEAHNVFVGAGEDMQSLLSQVKRAWSGATHIDAYSILEQVEGYRIVIHETKDEKAPDLNAYPKLVAYNIGYYKPGHFAEYHRLIPMVLKNKEDQWKDRLNDDPDFLNGQHMDEIMQSHKDDIIKVTGVVFDADDEIQIQDEIKGYTIELIPLEPGEEAKPNLLELGYRFVKELKEVAAE